MITAKTTPSTGLVENAALQKLESGAFVQDAGWISNELGKCQKDRFYGKLVLNMEAGLCVRIVQERSIKPPHRE